MKHEKTISVLTAAVLAFVTAWGAVGCLISAFRLPLDSGTSLIVLCGSVSVVSAVLYSFRRGGMVLLCFLALAAGYIHQDGTAAEQTLQLFYRLATVYDRAYGWGVPAWSDLPWDAGLADWPLGILGSLISLTVTWAVVRQRSVWFPMLMTVLPLCSCIVVTDTVPGEQWLMMVLAGLLLLLLTASVRRENAAQGIRLMLTAALPVVLALSALFLWIPQENYGNHSAVLRENILIAVQNIPKLMETGMNQMASGFQKQPARKVDLAALGARVPFTYPVMEVTAERTGQLYLREQDYDVYDGRGWTASEDRKEPFSATGGSGETILIQTKTGKNTRYLPYHPLGETILTGGFAENPERERTYRIHRSCLPEDWRRTAYENAVGATEEWQSCLALPEMTRQGAGELLTHLYDEGASNTAKADIIAAMVLDSARYDLDPGRMPAGETDFALWFLREGDAGYCVHFATAAAVLLRAAGVPARYVTGYLLDAVAGEPVTVTEENAHAWAEYYEPNLGVWLPLEATPADEAAAETVHPRPVPTVPEETLQEQTETAEETAPSGSQPTEAASTADVSRPEKQPASGERSPIPVMFILLPVLALMLAVQRTLRLSLRRRRQHMGTANQQGLQRWRESVRLARILKESPTEELVHLAQKAKFSQHELTAEDLMLFDSFNRTCLRRLKKRPWYLGLIYKYLYAAY